MLVVMFQYWVCIFYFIYVPCNVCLPNSQRVDKFLLRVANILVDSFS